MPACVHRKKQAGHPQERNVLDLSYAPKHHIYDKLSDLVIRFYIKPISRTHQLFPSVRS